ncbi:MAG TPA: hypothetical protein VH934_21000 [Xanthobacteraceae bacterium]|jgi:hypothetical protein
MVDGFAGSVLEGAVEVPAWALLAGVALILAAFALVRARFDSPGAALAQAAIVVIAVGTGWWALDHFARRDIAAERRAFEARAFELAARALAPGSALACLDPLAGDAVEDACERAVFASPEATAAAVAYVEAQLALLAAAGAPAARASASSPAARLRRALEADRFGIVAHVLAARDDCTVERCDAFALLQDKSRISVNLAERPFESYVESHKAGWPTGAARPVAGNLPPVASVPPDGAPKAPNNLYFPSAKSIPPVNIMTAEPPGARDATTAGQAGTTRKPAQSAVPAHPPGPPAAPSHAAPVPLAPAQ